MKNGKNISKTRNWAFVVYPESAPENWIQMLEDTHIPCFVSPLHDRDVNDETGELKKAHYHVLLMLDGPITKKRADEIIEPFNGTKSAEYVKSLRGFTRYLAHLDDGSKASYDPEKIIALNGADLTKALKPSELETYKSISEIMLFCEENRIHEFSRLLNYTSFERSDWFYIIVEKPYLFTQFLHSLRHSQSQDEQRR